ncbi:hypothetical protein DL95DRAFT_398384 [Leptodontidium sp. 2 PMI_412]|nr:hypothetical protein DL95DRAFT_398384 [Leptodontidium sp. 2 PMI_412]
MPVRYAFTFAYFCGWLSNNAEPPYSQPLLSNLLARKTSRIPRYSRPENYPPILGQVAERSERRYGRMVGEGDELDNWGYANIRWINLGKLWITDSDVLERGSSEGDILWSHSLSAARL